MDTEENTSILEVLLSAVRDRLNFQFISEKTRIACQKLTHQLLEFTEKTLENLTIAILEDILHHMKHKKENYDKRIKKSSLIREQKRHSSRGCKKVHNVKKLSRKINKDNPRRSSVKYDSSGVGGTLYRPSNAFSSCDDDDTKKNDPFCPVIRRRKVDRRCWLKHGHDCRFDDCYEPCPKDELKCVQKTNMKPGPYLKCGANESLRRCKSHRYRRNDACLKVNFNNELCEREDDCHVYELLKSISVSDEPGTSNRKQRNSESEQFTVSTDDSDGSSTSETSICPKETTNVNFESNMKDNNHFSDSSSSV